ncbi:MAG: hypothetical protein JST85_18430 [Acidobacteria bacterium]|nr:hypothetical protein [Acidobacteriota bacterium]
MSDIGTISQDYQTTADLFRAINQSVILVKKKFYHLSGALQISDLEIRQAKGGLSRIVHELISRLESPSIEEVGEDDLPSVPTFLLRRIQEQHRGDMQWYLEDLRKLREALDYEQTVTEEQIQLLDELCEQLDAERTALHRKLWRK